MSTFRAATLVGAAMLAACAAVGVPESGDPWTKYLQGCALMEAGRELPAERLLRESMTHYETRDEPLRLAMVQMQYALLVESPGFVVHPAFAAQRSAMGGRAALPAKARELNARAKSNLLKASSRPASSAERTQALLLLVEAHARLGERAEACATIERAEESYVQSRQIDYAYAIYRHKTVPDYLSDRRERLKCAK